MFSSSTSWVTPSCSYTSRASGCKNCGRLRARRSSSALLHEMGTREVKQGATLSIVNLYSNEIGNPETPKKFKAEEAREKKPEASVPILRKSIAVLPFENLSEDKANAYFADGIQEEILTRLSRIADLKVISRTSTQRF